MADSKGERFGIWIRLAAKRFFDDMDRAHRRGNEFTFSWRHANRACRFVENLPHVEGTWDTPNITLVPAQAFFLACLFGFRDADGGRRFTSAVYAVARKNAKSTLAAAIMLYVFCEEPEPGTQIFAAATTGDQAKVVWRIAKQMIERCWDLRMQYNVEAYSLEIRRFGNGGTFKAINAKASTQDGLNPQAFVLDEVHAHRTHDLMNVLTSAAGARVNPLFLYTTTEGYETPGPWPELRLFSQNVLKGLTADHFLAVLYSLDEEDKMLGTKYDDDFDESKWVKANPLYDTNPVLRNALRKYADEAKGMPGKLGEFRIKRLNRQSSAAKAWVDIVKWKRCSGKVDLEFLRGYPCWAAFDLANTTDMAAWAIVWYVEGKWYCFVRYWVPQDAVEKRTERRSAPYQNWIEQKWVTPTPGDVIDYQIIEAQIVEDVRVYQPVKIAYDPWNAQQFVTQLTNQGLELEIFIQGPKSYNPAMQALEVAYTSTALNHGGNPVLQWNAANLVPRYDVNLNMAPDKKRSADKIDGMVALLMAFGFAVRETQDDSSGFFSSPVKT
jgi:phage terminase large subunit-like protein